MATLRNASGTKAEVIVIGNPKNRMNAEAVMADNGFVVISNWFNDNIYEKEGVLYGLSHPVWTWDNKVRVFPRNNPEALAGE